MNEPFGDTEQLAHPAAGVPDGWVSVPREPTAEIIAGAAMAAWPCASPADIEMARKAADIVLGTAFDLGPGMTKDLLAATIATMAPAYRAMLAAAPAAPMHQTAPVERQGARDALIDVTDPWRGLYRAERLRANGDGDLYHPDLPSWPDDREDALDKLVRAQGFDFQVVAGEFTEEAIEDGDELYWQEMRAWNPEAPEGDWRLAWKGDIEDGPYAWFVRPMALRPEPEAIAARQPVGDGEDYQQGYQTGYSEGVAQYSDDSQRPVAWRGFCSDGVEFETCQTHCEANPGYWQPLYAAPPAPAAVPVDERQDAAIIEAAKLAYGLLWMGTDLTGPDLAHRARVALRDALGKQACGDGITAARATHPQPAAAIESSGMDGDMFWLAEDGETFGHSVEEVLDGCDDGAEVEIQQATRLSNVWVRVRRDDDELSYDVIDNPAAAGGDA